MILSVGLTFGSSDTIVVIIGETEFCEGGSTELTTADSYSEYLWSNGETTSQILVSQPGIYCVTVTDTSGCTAQSCVTVTQFSPAKTLITFTACEGDGFLCAPVCPCLPPFDVCTDTILTHHDCDSIIEYTFVFLPLEYAYVELELCYGDSFLINGSVYSMNGLYEEYLVSSHGCDSIVTIDLSIEPVIDVLVIHPDNGLGTGEIHLSDAIGNTSFLWSSGHSGPSATGLTAGTYSVTVTSENGCTGVETYLVPQSIPVLPSFDPIWPFEAYPNPTDGNITISIPESVPVDRLMITDLNGRQLLRHDGLMGHARVSTTIDGPPGVYFLLLSNDSQKFVHRIIME